MAVTAPNIESHPLAKCCWCNGPFVKGLVSVAGLQPWTCANEPCWRRQVANAIFVQIKGQGKRCVYVPLPRQVEFFEATGKHVLFGGAAGGSKSHAIRWLAYRECLKTPGFRALILRRTYKELEQTHLREAELDAALVGGTAVPSAKVMRFPNGSLVQFGHCETAADAGNYLSAEYELILFDEVVTFEQTPFLLISSRARTSKPGLTPQIRCGTNPGGPQAHWVRSRFIDHTVDLQEYPDYQPDEWQFIESKLEDNPYLNKDYERSLMNLPPELRKAYRDGDWDIFPGQYFPEWRRATHVSAEHRVFPPDLPRVLSMDWGFVKPGSVGWWVLCDGHAYREQEYIFTRTTAHEVGKEIARRCEGLTNLKYLVFDTAMEIPNNDSGESTIETVRRGMRAGGLALATRPADKDRVNGWQRLRHWLGRSPDGSPWLSSSPLCAYFNRTMPALVSDESKPEDVDTDGDDHAADDARYFVMSRPTPGVVEKKTVTKEGTLGWYVARSQKPASAFGREVRLA